MSHIFDKYIVSKKDGSPIDPSADYFVLRIDTDPAARFALHAYAGYIARSDPQFSRALLAWVAQYEGASNTRVQADDASRCPICGGVHKAPSFTCPNIGIQTHRR